MLSGKIQNLKEDILGFTSLLEGMIEKAVQGLLKKNRLLLEEVIHADEPVANANENKIDEACVHLIAQYQPAAVDLRVIMMISKMNNDLERMADHAVNICESSLFLIERPLVKPLIDLPRMGHETINMLKDSINAFVNKDGALAEDVCKRDEIVDDFMAQILRELITFMLSDPATIERSLHLIRIAHNLERIADLATNICEDVIFMTEGKIIKHHAEG